MWPNGGHPCPPEWCSLSAGRYSAFSSALRASDRMMRAELTMRSASLTARKLIPSSTNAPPASNSSQAVRSGTEVFDGVRELVLRTGEIGPRRRWHDGADVGEGRTELSDRRFRAPPGVLVELAGLEHEPGGEYPTDHAIQKIRGRKRRGQKIRGRKRRGSGAIRVVPVDVTGSGRAVPGHGRDGHCRGGHGGRRHLLRPMVGQDMVLFEPGRPLRGCFPPRGPRLGAHRMRQSQLLTTTPDGAEWGAIRPVESVYPLGIAVRGIERIGARQNQERSEPLRDCFCRARQDPRKGLFSSKPSSLVFTEKTVFTDKTPPGSRATVQPLLLDTQLSSNLHHIEPQADRPPR